MASGGCRISSHEAVRVCCSLRFPQPLARHSPRGQEEGNYTPSALPCSQLHAPCSRALETDLQLDSASVFPSGEGAVVRRSTPSSRMGRGESTGNALGSEAEPGKRARPDTLFPTLSPAVGAGCRPAETARLLKGPSAQPRPPRPVAG